jgi:FtsP/CotA-like multicopper oxidase with cupredoxin domain
MTTQIGAIPSDPYVAPDTVPPLPVAGVLETTITASLETIISGTTTVNAETYNGTIPGPTLRLNIGDTAIVRLINKLPYPTGIHWHGIELANSADGTEVTRMWAMGSATPPAPPGGTYSISSRSLQGFSGTTPTTITAKPVFGADHDATTRTRPRS